MRGKNYLFIISLIISVFGLLILFCIPWAVYFQEPLFPFLASSIILIVTGLLFYLVSGGRLENIDNNKDRIILVVISWCALILAGMLPYLFSESIPNIIDVFFETVSGLTSTGTSILMNIDALPKSILFWRSFTQWIGGAATIIFLITILNSMDIGGFRLLSGVDRIISSKTSFIKIFITTYVLLTLFEVLLLFVGGMNLFESMCYSFGTVSSGGFSPSVQKIANYSSFIQYIIASFMMISGGNYLVFFLMYTKKTKQIFCLKENTIYLIVIGIVTILLSVVSYSASTGKEIELSFREGLFHSVSLVASSGYSNSTSSLWVGALQPFIYLLIFIGGCSVSTSGGIKISRFLILLKNIKNQFSNRDNHTEFCQCDYRSNSIGRETNLSVLTFITIYGIVFMAGTIFISFSVPDIEQSVFLALSALSTFGHDVSLHAIPDFEKIIIGILMLSGRLEIYPVFLLFFPVFYKRTYPIS